MIVLVINTGSSSIKYEVFDMAADRRIGGGAIEGIGQGKIADHRAGLRRLIDDLLDAENGMIADPAQISAVGHRVVHGGESLTDPVVVDDAVEQKIEENVPLAPLHNPANLLGIRTAREMFPAVPQVAVFDTAFHRTMPQRAYLYALPYHLYEDLRLRRYGFHGTSHAYVTEQAARLMDCPVSAVNLITLHLGNGASAAAVRAGQCIDTSMGMTPLEGLVMGTRCGDLDPSVPFFLGEQTGMTPADINALLNKESGLKGLCGEADMREVIARRDGGDARAAAALEVYVYRLQKYIGAYTAALGGVDGLVFTGGVGERSALIRQEILAGLEHIGLRLDTDRNAATCEKARFIHRDDGAVKIMVIPTDEERHIARQVMRVLSAS
ncbi:MAG: acetate kinase [Candidatus Omnitrophica bacterium]|nr:acetate kinase [Candidatus Omnitrophota bacterium]MCB9719274.1 acetate kinase [Candidatus Omnitrophota bacterium]